MIEEISLEKSINYQNYRQNTGLYSKGIHADTCIIVDGLETYYNRKEEVIYVENHDYFNQTIGSVERKGQITKNMLNELVNYLNWENWSISVYYYTFEKAIIMIKKIKDEQNSIKHLDMDVLHDDLLQVEDKKIPNVILTNTN